MGVFIFIIVVTPIVLGVGFLPTIIAFMRNHPQRWSIFAVNFSFGGSSLGWGGALTWALQNFNDAQIETVPQIETIPIEHEPLGDDLRECPHCAETIKAKAKVCRYCGNKLSPDHSA